MVDPNDYLHVQIRIGTGLCQVVTGSGREIMACRRGNDKAAVRDLRKFIDEIIDERAARPQEGA